MVGRRDRRGSGNVVGVGTTSKEKKVDDLRVLFVSGH